MRAIILGATILLVLTFGPGPTKAQSGRRAPQVPKNNPAAQPSDSTAEDLDNLAVTEGRLEGDGETIEGDTVRVNTTLVTVPVSVMDRNGKYVPNLERRDFRVFDNGVERRVAYFATVDQPFTVVLLIDTSGSTDFRMDEIQDAAISFVNQLKDQDRVMVMSFDDKIRVLCEPTSNRAELTRAIRRTKNGGGTRLYDAVEMALKQKLRLISGRKAVVLFTDGVDTTSRDADYSSTIRDAVESDGAVYSVAYNTANSLPINAGGLPGRSGGILNFPFPFPGGGGPVIGGPGPADYRRADEYLQEIARESGGRFFRGDTLVGLSSAFAHVADELRRQYSIGYYPPAGPSGQRRTIKVRVKQPDLVVKARDNYVYSQRTTTDENKSGKQPTESTQPAKPLMNLTSVVSL
ncbi:MAG: VWA domain-containing protein [Pyrinomonadaceae bacterium]|nr:VWA domain-containing protein [Pyrinomonadaceae bacterium]